MKFNMRKSEILSAYPSKPMFGSLKSIKYFCSYMYVAGLKVLLCTIKYPPAKTGEQNLNDIPQFLNRMCCKNTWRIINTIAFNWHENTRKHWVILLINVCVQHLAAPKL